LRPGHCGTGRGQADGGEARSSGGPAAGWCASRYTSSIRSTSAACGKRAACARPASPSCRASSGASSSDTSAAASASGSSGSTTSPVRRWITWSGSPPAHTTTGTPATIASPTTRGVPSLREGTARMSSPATRSAAASRKPQKPHPLPEESQVARQCLQRSAEPPVPDDDEAGLGNDAGDERRGAQEYIGAFLRDEPPGEADDGGLPAAWPGRARPDRESGDRGQHLDTGGRHVVDIDEHVAFGGRHGHDAAGPAVGPAAHRPRDCRGGGRGAGVQVRVHHVVPALGEEAAQRADVAQGQPPLDQRPGQDAERHVGGTQPARPDAGRRTRHLGVPPAGPERDREVDDVAPGATAVERVDDEQNPPGRARDRRPATRARPLKSPEFPCWSRVTCAAESVAVITSGHCALHLRIHAPAVAPSVISPCGFWQALCCRGACGPGGPDRRGRAARGMGAAGAGGARVGRRRFGHDAVSFRERGTRCVPAAAATAVGRDAPAGWGCAALTDARQGRRQPLPGAARRCCDLSRPAGGHRRVPR